MTTTQLTKENHDATVADGVVLIDFWADWCQPCKRFGPIFEAASEKHEDVTFAKVDTEDQTELSAKYGVTSIPMVVAYREGIPVYGQPGMMAGPQLEQLIEQIKGLDMDEVRDAYTKAQEEAGS